MKPSKNSSVSVTFPKVRAELLHMAKEDQQEIRENFHAHRHIKSETLRTSKFDEVAIHCHVRAKRMLELLEEVKHPTVQNIGIDGCGSVSLLTLHSWLDVMAKVLELFTQQATTNPIYCKFIPALTDRILILERNLKDSEPSGVSMAMADHSW